MIAEGSQGRGREKAGRAGTRGLGYTLFTFQAVEISGEQMGPVMPPLRVNRGVCVCVRARSRETPDVEFATPVIQPGYKHILVPDQDAGTVLLFCV